MTYRELKSMMDKFTPYKLDQQIKIKYLREDRDLYVDKLFYEENEDKLENVLLFVEQ